MRFGQKRSPGVVTRPAFTLVELLVVLGIIVLLLVLLLSSMNRAREMSRRTVCLSNIRQLTQAWMMYSSANNGRLCSSVGNPEWLLSDPQGERQIKYTPVENDPIPLIPNGQLWPYIKDRRVYLCPSDPQYVRNSSPTPPGVYIPGGSGTSYSMNLLVGLPLTPDTTWGVTMLSQIKNTQQRMVFFEGNDGWLSVNGLYDCEINSFHPSTSGSMGAIALSFADGHAIMWELTTWGGEQRQWQGINDIDNLQFLGWLTGLVPRGVTP